MPAEPFNLDDYAPKHWFFAPVWASALQFSIGHRETLAQFTADTGLTYSAPRSPLDAMIDKATGADADAVRAFVVWFNANLWGQNEDGSAYCPDDGAAASVDAPPLAGTLTGRGSK